MSQYECGTSRGYASASPEAGNRCAASRIPFGLPKCRSLPKGFHKIDLAPLDLCIWPKDYLVSLFGTADGVPTFLLRPRKIDPQDTNPQVEAFVSLDSANSTRKVVLHYARGEIELLLTPSTVGEYRLPGSADVTINMPGQVLAAHASLTDYAITRQTVAARP